MEMSDAASIANIIVASRNVAEFRVFLLSADNIFGRWFRHLASQPRYTSTLDPMTRVSRPPVAKRIYRTTATRGEGCSGREAEGGRRETRIVPSLRSQPGGGLDREMV